MRTVTEDLIWACKGALENGIITNGQGLTTTDKKQAALVRIERAVKRAQIQAAAPDLYEAVKTTVKRLEALDFSEMSGSDVYALIPWDKLESALQKAEKIA
jgi:hypothetical protein